MAAILASHSWYCRNVELANQGKAVENLSFSSSISSQNFSNLERQTCNPHVADKFFRFQVEMRKTESPVNLATNGRATKMVPTSEIVKKRYPYTKKVETVNGSSRVVNGASIVKRDSASALVKAPKNKQSTDLPLIEELKVLPSDEGFSWANENYNSWQRSMDVWSFVISLRIRVLFDNAKWAYLGGFTEEKQVSFDSLSWFSGCDLLQCVKLFIMVG